LAIAPCQIVSWEATNNLTTLTIISKWKGKDPTKDEYDSTLAALSLIILIVDVLKISKNDCFKEKINCEGK